MTARPFVSALLFASITAVVFAQAPALDVKMGLWEMTSVTDLGGQMPAVDTSKMTPQQKAQIDAAMQSMMGTHTNVMKSCITKEKFSDSTFMMPQQPGQTCKQVLTTNTRTTLEGSVTCTGANAMAMQMHMDALSSTSIKATVKSAQTNRGRTMNVTATMTGKWLGADCGDTK